MSGGVLKLGNEAKPLARSFDLLHDIFDRIDRRCKESHGIASVYQDGLVKAYIEGRASAESVMVIDGRPSNWKLVFRAVEDGIERDQLAGGNFAVMDSYVR